MVGSSLAAAAGLNAWIPLLAVGLLARFTDLIALPSAWAWLTGDVALWVIGALLVVEVIADKIPALDTVNDVIHTAIRPAAGGIAFGAGSAAETLRLDGVDAAASIDWGPIITGIVIALVVHGIKATVRPIANTATAGIAAPVVSTVEDITSVTVSVLAILVPVIAIVVVVAMVSAGLWIVITTRRRHARRARVSGA